MKYRCLIPLFILAFLLQTTFFSALPVFGVTADLLLLLALLLPIYYEGKRTFVLTFLFGLLRDVCFGAAIGPSALLCLLLSAIVSLLRGSFYAEKFYTIPLIVIPGTALYQFLYWGYLRLLGRPYALMTMLGRLPAAIVLELFAGLVFYMIIGRKPGRFAARRDLFERRKEVRV